jgi:hypothetical protein
MINKNKLVDWIVSNIETEEASVNDGTFWTPESYSDPEEAFARGIIFGMRGVLAEIASGKYDT